MHPPFSNNAGKRAIVTGGAGFIGSHLVDALVSEHRRVTVIDDLSTGDIHRVNPEAEFLKIDISDGKSFSEVLSKLKPDAIFHLGAQSSVTVSVKDPAKDCRVNVIGTLNVVQASREHGCPVIFTSTGGALYGNKAPLPTPESFRPAPVSPYGASKWAAEAYISTWAEADQLPHSICRLGNVYGPRQSPFGEAGVVSILSHKIWSGKQPVLFGHGRPTRDYIHVHDVVEGLMRAADGPGGVFNIATGQETSVLKVYEIIARQLNSSAEPILTDLRPGELEQSCMDSEQGSQILGWTAKINLEDGIGETCQALIKEFEQDNQ